MSSNGVIASRLKWTFLLGGVASALLLAVAWFQWLPLDNVETFGAVTGAWCVWLAVNQIVWNWPVGIANNVAYIFVYWNARLFGHMALQGVYIALSLYGIYAWLRGGEQHRGLRVSHVSARSATVLALLGVAATYGLTLYLRSVNDAAPFLDALTTVMSLIAQFLLARKYLENWYVWIAADVIYIALYISRALYLTAVLYFLFLLLCIAGAREWRAAMQTETEKAAEPVKA